MGDGIQAMVGKTITRLIDNSDHTIFVCGDEAFEAIHSQDCCEHVRVHDVSGNPLSLVGEKVTSASHESSGDWPDDVEKPRWTDSYTWTTITVSTEKGTVVWRWLGESNGYYGEGVYFNRTHVPM